MTDEAKALVERLQSPALVFLTDTPASASILSKLGREAADLIETQAREIERLRRIRASLAKQLSIAERKLKSVTKLWHADRAALAALAGDSYDQ